MTVILNKDEKVVKAFNNNVVLVYVGDKEKILFGKGIGFGKKPGDIINKGLSVDKVFVIEEAENRRNLFSVIEQTNEEFFGLCEEAIVEVAHKIDCELNESIHIGLIDHLYLAVKRIKCNERIDNPFLLQIQTLYSKEYSLASIVADKIGRVLKIKFPEDEIGFIALHIHSAITDRKIHLTLKDNYLGNKIVEYVESELGFNIDKKSLDYARFLTHIKFAIQRILENERTDNTLSNVIREEFKDSYKIANNVAKIIEEELNVEVYEGEVSFLAIHIERFKISRKK